MGYMGVRAPHPHIPLFSRKVPFYKNLSPGFPTPAFSSNMMISFGVLQ